MIGAGAWRSGYPRLTEVGAWHEQTVGHMSGDEVWTFDGTRHGGFYTQEGDRARRVRPQARHHDRARIDRYMQAAIAAYRS